MKKKLIIFDLDGTLTDSKKDLTKEMGEFLADVASKHAKIAIISGCNWHQMCNQFFNKLPNNFDTLWNTFMLPTSGGELWTWDGPESGCINHYSNELTLREKVKIYVTFDDLYRTELLFWDYKWGEIAEDRKSQITFSLLGQNAPLEEKKTFDPGGWNRKKLAKAMQERLPGFEIRVGGATSIDVTKAGINKAYGIQKLIEHIREQDIRCLEHQYDCGEFEGIPVSCNQKLTIEDAIYIGDALQDGGNDAIVKVTGIDTIETKGPSDTIRIVKSLLP